MLPGVCHDNIMLKPYRSTLIGQPLNLHKHYTLSKTCCMCTRGKVIGFVFVFLFFFSSSSINIFLQDFWVSLSEALMTLLPFLRVYQKCYWAYSLSRAAISVACYYPVHFVCYFIIWHAKCSLSKLSSELHEAILRWKLEGSSRNQHYWKVSYLLASSALTDNVSY